MRQDRSIRNAYTSLHRHTLAEAERITDAGQRNDLLAQYARHVLACEYDFDAEALRWARQYVESHPVFVVSTFEMPWWERTLCAVIRHRWLILCAIIAAIAIWAVGGDLR
jgi:hypothetical protein